MYNWSTDTKAFRSVEAKERFELEQLINFGLCGTKLSKDKLLQYWNVLELDPARRAFLSLLLYGRQNTYSNTNKTA